MQIHNYPFKLFELSNHLANVLVTVSDKKGGVDEDSNGVIDRYTANVITATDNYPFGMVMPGRKFTTSGFGYRFGFSNKEMDNEVKGFGNSIDFGARVNDTRLGRWLTVDPLAAMYPFQSTYVSMGNNPISRIDPTGMGDYYTQDGKHLGSDGKMISQGKGKNAKMVADDKAYVTSQSIINQYTKDGKTDWDAVIANSRTSLLGVKNSQLTDFASSIADESSGDKIESFAIGNAVVKGSKIERKTIQQFLRRYTSGYDSKVPYSKLPDNYKYSMGAAINAVTGGIDYSNGATRWDGRDLLTQGLSHYRYAKAAYDNRQGIFIPSNLQSEVHGYIENVL